ncbi:hypothetical protein SBY92_004804 [Candida maltosa Xu316]
MIDTEVFVAHGETSDKFNLNNTTSDLLKFQLQEQYRNSLKTSQEGSHNTTTTTTDSNTTYDDSFLQSQQFQDSFNSHLQSQLETGEIHLSNSTGTYSSTSTSTSTSTYIDDQPNGSHPIDNTGIDDDDDDDDDDNLDSFISTTSHKPNYLNLKILIENSIFDSNKIKSSILDFSSLNELKNNIENKTELHKYLLSKIAMAQNFNKLVISNEEHVDTNLLIKIIKTQSTLQTQLIETTNELETLKEKLSNHYFSCLSLGYIEDIRVSKNMNSTSTLQQSPLNSPGKILNSGFSSPTRQQHQQQQHNFDSVIAHVANVAVQRNITLPQPPTTESTDSKIYWLQQCIDSILSNTKPEEDQDKEDVLTGSGYELLNNKISPISPMRSSSPDKMIYEYKTALNDLRFSYEYLAKEYELSRNSSNKLIHDYRKKINTLEKDLLSKNNNELITPPASSSSSASAAINGSDTLENKDKEISRLRKELNLIKIDKLGKPYNTHHNSSSTSFLASPNMDSMNHLSVSPITGESLNIPESSILTEVEDEDNTSVNSHGRPVSTSGFSNGILRKEFKKIVSDIQDQYEMELAEERMRRRKLEEELNKSSTH